MKKLFSSIIALMCLVGISLATSGALSAQEVIRHNYKNNGYTHIGTERLLVKTGSASVGTEKEHPLYVKLEYIGLPNGSDVYKLTLDFPSSTSVNIPKGVKMSVTLSDGKFIRFEQIYTETTDKHAFTIGNSQVYWNHAEYLSEKANIEKIVSGVKNIDVMTGWGVDSYINCSFPDNEFGKAVAKEFSALKAETVPSGELGDNVAEFGDRFGSRTVITKTLDVPQADSESGKPDVSFRVTLSYLYYKSSNNEDYDFHLLFTPASGKTYTVSLGDKVTFRMSDGKSMVLEQQRDEYNAVFLYPTAEQLKTLAGVGSSNKAYITGVTIETDNGTIAEDFSDTSFSHVLNVGYNSLQTLSVL